MASVIMNPREAAKKYLVTHQIPQMFESLIACLMVECPEDPVSFIEKKMQDIKDIGLENVNWETFVLPLHPYRDPVRLAHIRDGSKFDKEREKHEEGDVKKETSEYEPDVFKLTESAQ